MIWRDIKVGLPIFFILITIPHMSHFVKNKHVNCMHVHVYVLRVIHVPETQAHFNDLALYHLQSSWCWLKLFSKTAQVIPITRKHSTNQLHYCSIHLSNNHHTCIASKDHFDTVQMICSSAAPSQNHPQQILHIPFPQPGVPSHEIQAPHFLIMPLLSLVKT